MPSVLSLISHDSTTRLVYPSVTVGRLSIQPELPATITYRISPAARACEKPPGLQKGVCRVMVNAREGGQGVRWGGEEGGINM